MGEWKDLYQLPPKDVFFKLLDTRVDLILENYAVRREQTWDQILRRAQAPIVPTPSTDVSFQSERGLPPLRHRGRDIQTPVRHGSALPMRRDNSYRQVYEADAVPVVAKLRRASSRRVRASKEP